MEQAKTIEISENDSPPFFVCNSVKTNGETLNYSKIKVL